MLTDQLSDDRPEVSNARFRYLALKIRCLIKTTRLRKGEHFTTVLPSQTLVAIYIFEVVVHWGKTWLILLESTRSLHTCSVIPVCAIWTAVSPVSAVILVPSSFVTVRYSRVASLSLPASRCCVASSSRACELCGRSWTALSASLSVSAEMFVIIDYSRTSVNRNKERRWTNIVDIQNMN